MFKKKIKKSKYMSKVCEKVGEKVWRRRNREENWVSSKVGCYLQRTRVKSQDLGRHRQRWQIIRHVHFVWFDSFHLDMKKDKRTSCI